MTITHITARLSPMGVGRDNGPSITSPTHLFRFIYSHQTFHAYSSVMVVSTVNPGLQELQHGRLYRACPIKEMPVG